MIVHRYVCDKCKAMIGEYKRSSALSIEITDLKTIDPLPQERFPIEDQHYFTSGRLHFCDRYCLSEFLDERMAELRQRIEGAKEDKAEVLEEESIDSMESINHE